MPVLFKHKGVLFDDFVDEGESYWSQICWECLDKHPQLKASTRECGGTGLVCGVEGCYNEADFYIDFKDEEVKVCTK